MPGDTGVHDPVDDMLIGKASSSGFHATERIISHLSSKPAVLRLGLGGPFIAGQRPEALRRVGRQH